ncbi:MAG: hypothetical protein M1820_008780 [Bogoriella megaspora]|nr:MAG: hypothetical protein M1820_008780 [Bogoriella megaspora]
MAAPNAGQSEFKPWNEAQCKAGLAHLEMLQFELQGLRKVIPDILDPLITKQQIGVRRRFAIFKHNSQDSYKRLDQFSNRRMSKTVKEIIDYTNGSEKHDDDLRKAFTLPEFGWAKSTGPFNEYADKDVQPELAEDISALAPPSGPERDSGVKGKDENMATVVESFRQKHPEFHTQADLPGQTMQVSVPSTGGSIKFLIKGVNKEVEGKTRWDVECPGSQPLLYAITRCFASRPQAGNLSYTLEMIAAYKDARKETCVGCRKLVSNMGVTPAARRSKTVKAEGTKKEEIWEAFHEGCIPR